MIGFSKFREDVRADKHYAHTIYCNLVMPIIDAGVKRPVAEDATERIMHLWFGVKKEHYKH